MKLLGKHIVAKQHAELLTLFDMLLSHLGTTFIALSTVFACCQGSFLLSDSLAKSLPCKFRLAWAYLAILVGPCLSTPKLKMIFTVDGLDGLSGARGRTVANLRKKMVNSMRRLTMMMMTMKKTVEMTTLTPRVKKNQKTVMRMMKMLVNPAMTVTETMEKTQLLLLCHTFPMQKNNDT